MIELVTHQRKLEDWSAIAEEKGYPVSFDVMPTPMTWSGAAKTPTKGTTTFQYMAVIYLDICNAGKTPTFCNAITDELLDLTHFLQREYCGKNSKLCGEPPYTITRRWMM